MYTWSPFQRELLPSALGPWVILASKALRSYSAASQRSLPSPPLWRRLNPTPFGHYSYLRRFVPSPFFVLSETCCFLILSSSAFLSLPGQAQIRASKQRRPRTCPLGIREEEKKGLNEKNLKRPLLAITSAPQLPAPLWLL